MVFIYKLPFVSFSRAYKFDPVEEGMICSNPIHVFWKSTNLTLFDYNFNVLFLTILPFLI